MTGTLLFLLLLASPVTLSFSDFPQLDPGYAEVSGWCNKLPKAPSFYPKERKEGPKQMQSARDIREKEELRKRTV